MNFNQFLMKLTGYRSRYNYWSNSFFATWLRKVFKLPEQPGAATSEEWYEFKQLSKATNKMGYWIVDKGLNNIQNIVYLPVDIYRNIHTYLKNRFVDKIHYLPTNLKKGEYFDTDTRLLNGVFETLVQFVEEEKAGRYCIEHEPVLKMIGVDDEHFFKQLSSVMSKQEMAIKVLNWEISLGEESPFQAEAAKEIKEIYLWWKVVRPNRPDPDEISGWSAFCKENPRVDFFSPRTKEQKDMSRKLIDESSKIEEQYYNEDTEMMVRLIKIRKALWD